ncbi:hypothetical protein [Ralstonia pickettii]|uniref:hypothetical protein n=1 Tax=Ralstonia pickettii TaxID=329 RepID=UPI00046A593F|nr:hypothetical protein [Ralstonia pickettii]
MKATAFITTALLSASSLLAACASTEGSPRVVLPLDHGPRAQTTPWENQQRLLRAEKAARAKENAGAAQEPNQ